MNNKIVVPIIVIVLLVIAGIIFYQYWLAPKGKITSQEKACLESEGIVSTATCCKAVSDFPNTCLVGACGCSSEDSYEVKICDCGTDKCFDGTKCTTIELIEEEEETQEKVVKESTGFIEGSLSYPSEFIPGDMVICAENIATKKLYYALEQIKDKKYTYGTGYKIEVPAGDYYVYAFVDTDKDNKAYYSEFVTCGLEASCPSHEPIKVTVKGGQTKSGIDPQDWYNY